MPLSIARVSADDTLWAVQCAWSDIATLLTDQATWEDDNDHTLPVPFSMLIFPPTGEDAGDSIVSVEGIETTPFVSIRGRATSMPGTPFQEAPSGDVFVTIVSNMGLAYVHFELGSASTAGPACWALVNKPYDYTNDAISAGTVKLRVVSSPSDTSFPSYAFASPTSGQLTFSSTSDPDEIRVLYVGPIVSPCTVCELAMGKAVLTGSGQYTVSLDTYVIKGYCPS